MGQKTNPIGFRLGVSSSGVRSGTRSRDFPALLGRTSCCAST